MASSCLQTVARELVGREGGGGVRECLGQLLEGLLGQEAVVGRYGEVVEETLGLLASGFRERQVCAYSLLVCAARLAAG